jgi:transcriptional regulator with XRE-family HTH domain
MIEKAIGLRIKQIRNKNKMTQERLSFKCSLSRSYIGDVELGKRNISVVTLLKIIKSLDIDLKTFFDSDLFMGL